MRWPRNHRQLCRGLQVSHVFLGLHWSRHGRVATLALLGSLLGCRGLESPPAGAATSSGATEPQGAGGLDPSAFNAGVLQTPTETVNCTLSNGTVASCYRLKLQTTPTDHKVGPFCPRTIESGPEVSGTWIHEGEVLDADGAFIVGLAELYDDPKWKLYDESTGEIRYTATKEACEAAARPDVEEAYRNHCVECSVEDLEAGLSEDVLIPAQPVPRATPGTLGGRGPVGVALNGVRLDAPAPLQAILSAHTIAAFDDCGGHVNPHAGYHYHGARGCSASVPQNDAHAALIGYAVDGYAIHAMRDGHGDEAGGLDVCRGHVDDVRGYHYHAASAGENMFIGCLHGETAQSTAARPGLEPRGRGGSGPPGGHPGGGHPAGRPANGGPPPCQEKSSTRCCGDGTCDGPETPANCPGDCATAD